MKAAPLSKKKEKSLCLLIVRSLIAAVLKPFTASVRKAISQTGGRRLGKAIAPLLSFGDIRVSRGKLCESVSR